MAKEDPKRDGESAAETVEPLWGVRAGWVAGCDSQGRPLIDFTHNRAGPLVASKTVPFDEPSVRRAATNRQPVLLSFENGDPKRPIIVGLMEGKSEAPLLEAMLDDLEEGSAAAPREAEVDGKKVLIEGSEEIVLRCGQASLTLRRDGKIVLKGTYVETHASGVNRIKGGSVQIN